jgi:hypothetical protein
MSGALYHVQLKPLSVALMLALCSLCFHSLRLVQLQFATRPPFWFGALTKLNERCTLNEGLDPKKKPIKKKLLLGQPRIT